VFCPGGSGICGHAIGTRGAGGAQPASASTPNPTQHANHGGTFLNCHYCVPPPTSPLHRTELFEAKVFWFFFSKKNSLLYPAQSMDSDILLVMITCANQDEARRIGTALVTERLAACVHLRAHESVYRWEGQIVREPEYSVMAKTIRGRYAALQNRVRTMHSYAVPAILAVKVETGDATFVSETGSTPE
jgi:periplasmic divalent cation tolerance protein